jgi:hypothetical protein
MRVKSLCAAMTVIICAASVSTQDQPSGSVPDRIVGAAEVYHLKEKNKTRAQVRIYPFGKPAQKGAPRDGLSMDVIFESDGPKVARPRYVYLAFSSDSATGPKYQKERDLTIYTEVIGGGFWSGTLRTRMLSSSTSPSGSSVEVLLASIDYERFLRIAEAHMVSINLGKTHFILNKEDIKALNDLNQAIEK